MAFQQQRESAGCVCDAQVYVDVTAKSGLARASYVFNKQQVGLWVGALGCQAEAGIAHNSVLGELCQTLVDLSIAQGPEPPDLQVPACDIATAKLASDVQVCAQVMCAIVFVCAGDGETVCDTASCTSTVLRGALQLHC